MKMTYSDILGIITDDIVDSLLDDRDDGYLHDNFSPDKTIKKYREKEDSFDQIFDRCDPYHSDVICLHCCEEKGSGKRRRCRRGFGIQ